jgi:hypothetical protein
MRATDSVSSWIGKGVVMPWRSSASAISGRAPSSLKVVRILPVLSTSGTGVAVLPLEVSVRHAATVPRQSIGRVRL